MCFGLRLCVGAHSTLSTEGSNQWPPSSRQKTLWGLSRKAVHLSGPLAEPAQFAVMLPTASTVYQVPYQPSPKKFRGDCFCARSCCELSVMARGRKAERLTDPLKRKKRRQEEISLRPERAANPFLRSWAWKREHRPDKDRFKNPYHHNITVAGESQTLVLHQAPFSTAGFASTVWDSAIVLAKYLEKWPGTVVGKQCIELGAGCGLAGIAAAALGAKKTILTDFPENLPLLDRNIVANNLVNVVSTAPLTWGHKLALEISTCDVILATDVMYYDDAVEPLLLIFQALSGKNTRIFLSYGRNRQAEVTFMKAVGESSFSLRKLSDSELDDVYQCVDVDVYELGTRDEIIT